MKIRVTFILLLCTSFAANTKNTIKAQWMSSNSKFLEKKDLMKRALPNHQVYEYSRSMESINGALRNEDSGSQGQITEPVYPSNTVKIEDLPNGSSTIRGEESGKSLQQLNIMRINSKQPSQIFEARILPLGEEVLSRKRKDKMEQALLAMLMAYKMKFTALIPILLGGLSLLVSTTALAGFFFALFAAVLGLKAH